MKVQMVPEGMEQARPEGDLGTFGVIADYVALTKPRIMFFLLFTAFSAMVVALGHLPTWRLLGCTLLGLAFSTGGAASLNMWYDRDIDRVMDRTRHRPIPAGRVQARYALAFGLLLETLSLVLLTAEVNGLTALLALAGFVYYVFVYTIWLKRVTPHNIVIGGGAGAFPPLVGWAAATGHLATAAACMFLIVFLWTPPHFWALALYKNDDYVRAGVPMMPVVRGERQTKWQSLGYAVLLTISSILLWATHVVGWRYGVGALVLGLVFILVLIRLLAERLPAVDWAKRTFRYSLLYLLGIFGLMLANIHP